MAFSTNTSKHYLKALPALLILALVFVMALALIDDPDVWWHLKCGELFLRHGWIPREEIFSYTSVGAPWVDGYLFPQSLLYLAWLCGGAAGVCILGAALVTASYALSLFMSRHGPGYYAALAGAAPAAFLSIESNYPRPALLTPLFALIILCILENNRKNGGRSVWLLIPLMTLWVNSHPAFFIGMALTGIYIIGAFRNAPLRNRLPVVLAGQILATLINPYGLKIYYSAFSFASDPRIKGIIYEWKPMYSRPTPMLGIMPCFIFLALLGLSAIILAGRRNRLERIIIFLLIFLGALFARRNQLLCAVLALPIISWTFSESRAAAALFGESQSILKRGKIAARICNGIVSLVALVLIWFVATDRLYYHQCVYRKTGLGINGYLFSEKLVALLKSEHMNGNIFHEYASGGYFLFNLYPEYRVYIDGRMYPYSYDLFWNNLRALGTPKFFEQLRSRYDIRAVILMTKSVHTPLMEYLLNSSSWAAVFADDGGALFLARGVGNDSIISRHEINLLAEPPALETRPAGRSFRAWNKAELPYSIIQWGMAYDDFGMPDLAMKLYQQAGNYQPRLKAITEIIGPE